jgi:hypothetical protein
VLIPPGRAGGGREGGPGFAQWAGQALPVEVSGNQETWRLLQKIHGRIARRTDTTMNKLRDNGAILPKLLDQSFSLFAGNRAF